MSKIYCVVYRTGGNDNFKWKRSLGMGLIDASECRLKLIKMGYHALYPQDYEQSIALGLPETYLPEPKFLNREF